MLWLASLRWMNDFKLKLESIDITEHRIEFTILFVLWLFPPIGCVLVAFLEVFLMVDDILKGFLYLIMARLVLIVNDENNQERTFKQFHGKISCFIQSIPMLVIQIYILVANSNKVNVDVLHISIAFSILHIVYNLHKLNQHAKYNGINMAHSIILLFSFG